MTSKKSVLRKFTSFLLALTLCWTTVACGGNSQSNRPYTQNVSNQSTPTRLNNGEYPVQQGTYNDANGEYSLFLLNTPPGTPATFRTTNLQMARLTKDEESAGKKSYLKVENGQTSLHLTEDFKIEYIHAVTETRTNPQTGQPQTVVIRQESGGFWAPFAGAVAGNLVGSLLFTPQYYVPPVYQPGVRVMTGYGGSGRTYDQAVTQYQTRYQAPPPAVKNNPSILRTTGKIRNSSTSSSQPSADKVTTPSTNNRPTGSGVGGSTLRSTGESAPSGSNRTSSFGSGQSSGSSSRRSSGFRSRRR